MKKPSWLDEFKVFISRGNVIDLAVGVVVGGAFTAIVTALVNDIINPLISLIIGGLDFSGVTVGVFPIGDLIMSIINFLCISFVVFWMVKIINRFNRKKEKEAFEICQKKIRAHNLEMKLIDAEYTFDNNKMLFYFTADGRIDFRELVKDLAAVFKTRIELRQIGVRDETKIVGGIGICGRPLCCASYLSEFIPVSIKMAKEQNLSLNPTKISGVCGRLMCCLKYEEDTYEELNGRLPNIGDYVTTDDGLKGEVHSVSILRQLVKVIVTVNNDEKEIREYKVDQLKFRPKKRREKQSTNDAELKQLEALEKKEGKSKLDGD